MRKVTETEKKYNELSKAKDSLDSVCGNTETEMYTAPGKAEEDNLSSHKLYLWGFTIFGDIFAYVTNF